MDNSVIGNTDVFGTFIMGSSPVYPVASYEVNILVPAPKSRSVEFFYLLGSARRCSLAVLFKDCRQGNVVEVYIKPMC